MYKVRIFKALGISYNFDNNEYLDLEKQLKIIRLIDELDYKLLILQYIINLKIKNYKQDDYIVNILKYSNKTKSSINSLMEYMFINENNLNRVNIKYILNKIGYSKFKRILNLKSIYYCKVLNKTDKNIKECIKIIDDIINNKECYTIKDLKLDGNDLKEIGYKGYEIGQSLNYLLEEVIKNPKINSKNILIKKLKDIN